MNEVSWVLSKDPVEMVKHLIYKKGPTFLRERDRMLVTQQVFKDFVEASRGSVKMTVTPYEHWSSFAEDVARSGLTYFFDNRPTHDP